MADEPLVQLSEAEAIRRLTVAIRPFDPFAGDPKDVEPFGDYRDVVAVRAVYDYKPPASAALPMTDAYKDGESWQRVDLGPFLDGTHRAPEPTLLLRDDGAGLLYPGEMAFLVGESGAGKGWLIIHAAAEVLAAGSGVLFLDFEDGPASIVARLLAVGVEPDAILNRFGYIHPVEPIDDYGNAALLLAESVEAVHPALVVIDAATDAMSLQGLNPNANDDAARFLAILARPLAASDACVVVVDHVPKATDGRTRSFAIGAQHKRAGAALTYVVDTLRPIEKGNDDGLVRIWCAKDRHGSVQAAAPGRAMPRHVADFHVAANLDGTKVVALLSTPAAPTAFRPTTLMERVSRHIEEQPGATTRQIRNNVRGNTVGKAKALEMLIEAGHVSREQDGQAHRHHSVTPYRAAEDVLSDTYRMLPNE